MADQELSAEQQDALLHRVRSEVQQQALQDLTQTVSKKCYEKCVSRPGPQLDSKAQSCLAMCMDRYIDTMQVVSQSIMNRNQNNVRQQNFVPLFTS